MNYGDEVPIGTLNVRHAQPSNTLPEMAGAISRRPDSGSVTFANGWSKEFFRISFLHLLEALPIPVVGADRSHNVRFVNAAGRSISSDFEKLIGTDVCSLFRRKGEGDAVRGLLVSAFDHRESQIRETELQIGTRMLRSRMHLRSIHLDDEQFVLLFLEDLATEGKLSIIKEVCKNLVQAFPGGVALFELWEPCPFKAHSTDISRSLMSAKLTHCNGNFTCMHGFESFGDLRGARFSEFVPEGSTVQTAVKKWIDNNLAVFFDIIEEPSLKGTVSQIAVTLVANPKDDAVTSFWMIKRDMKDVWTTEASGSGADSRFKALFDTLHEPVFILDNRVRYVAANPAGKALLGLSFGSVVGKTPEDLWGREAGTRMIQSILSVLEGKRSEDMAICELQGRPVQLQFTRISVSGKAEPSAEVLQIVRKTPDQLGSHECLPSTPRGSSPSRFPICRSKAMRRAVETAKELAHSDATVLLTGETGAGKDRIARFIHNYSSRSKGPFIQVNCAAVPKELAESELFGHEQGAFTGAGRRKRGLIELADGGTLFMDEIGETSIELQAKLLTFLDTQTFMRVGGVKRLSVDARILAATNRDLVEEVAAGHFRGDLFYRLNVLSIRVPSLKERKEDLPDLIEDILNELAETNKLRCVPRLDQSLIAELTRYDWPGNVRELRSVLQRYLVLPREPRLSLTPLDRNEANREWSFVTSFPEGRSLNDVLDDLKRGLIKEALGRTQGKRQEAAKLLGISRSALKHHMKSQTGWDN